MAMGKATNTQKDNITVLIADDHFLMRNSIRNILEGEPDISCIGEAPNGVETVKMCVLLKPNVVLMDIDMPIMNGIETTRRIKSSNTEIHILVLSAYNNDEYIVKVIQAGADGYLTKDVLTAQLVDSIRTVHLGNIVISPKVGHKLAHLLSHKSDSKIGRITDTLSLKEIELLDLAAQGLSNKLIAEKLDLSYNTVKTYMATIFSKLGVMSRTEAVILAVRKGLISVDNISNDDMSEL